jgi:hypothetical protein
MKEGADAVDVGFRNAGLGGEIAGDSRAQTSRLLKAVADRGAAFRVQRASSRFSRWRV